MADLAYLLLADARQELDVWQTGAAVVDNAIDVVRAILIIYNQYELHDSDLGAYS